MNSTRSLAILALLLYELLGRSASATEKPAPLAPEFTVSALNGSAVKSSEIPVQQRSVLIYVVPNCHPCETLLNLINKKEYPDLPSKAVVIVGRANIAKALKVAGKFPDLDEASWYADPSRDAFSKLRLRGVPVILGLRHNQIAWRINGLLDGDPKKVQRILAGWCRDKRPARRGTHQSTKLETPRVY
jgi:hypothetical protein